MEAMEFFLKIRCRSAFPISASEIETKITGMGRLDFNMIVERGIFPI
jgi:hypothetical protein